MTDLQETLQAIDGLEVRLRGELSPAARAASLSRLGALVSMLAGEMAREGRGEPRENGGDDAWLTAGEVAARLRVSKRFVYRNADRLGAVRAGRSVRFTEVGLARYQKRRTA